MTIVMNAVEMMECKTNSNNTNQSVNNMILICNISSNDRTVISIPHPKGF